MPLSLIISIVTFVAISCIAWGTVTANIAENVRRIDKHDEAIRLQREIMNGLQNDLMAQILILRQDVSEIKGELRNNK